MAKNAIRNEKRNLKNIAGDDRNLVLVDDDFQDADFEDKVWLFWRRHGKKTIAIAVLVFLSVLSVIIYTQAKKMHVVALQNEYTTLKTADERRAFAQENLADPIAGTVFYQLGNELFRAGKFVEAAADYRTAASVYEGFRNPDFTMPRDRAKFAEAVALEKAGQSEASQALLTALAGTLESDETIRGQAMYNLAVSALSRGDLDTARNWLNEMDRALSAQNMWHAEKANLLRMEPKLAALPELSAPATAPAH